MDCITHTIFLAGGAFLEPIVNGFMRIPFVQRLDEVYRAVAFFAFKYGRIDWLESNNEYWLERDAALRTDE